MALSPEGNGFVSVKEVRQREFDNGNCICMLVAGPEGGNRRYAYISRDEATKLAATLLLQIGELRGATKTLPR